MPTPVHADPRRGGRPTGLAFETARDGAALEMPVLFQLSDLSSGKVISPPDKARPQKPAEAPAATTPSAAATPPPPGTEPAGATTAATTPATAAETNVAAPAAAPLLAGATKAIEPAAAPTPDSPTIRERAQLRQRRQAAAQGDWFQTQGKYILVIFLVLLVGVIYVARRGSDDSPASPVLEPDLAAESTTAHTHAEPHDGPQLAETDAAAPDSGGQHRADEAMPVAVLDANPAASFPADAMVAPSTEESPAADAVPQVTLQAPVQDEPIERPADDGSLFPWASQTQPRVATRPAPELPASNVPLPQANPHFAPPSPSTGRQSAPPSVPTAYPSTGIDELTLPQPAVTPAEGAPAAYPVADPQSRTLQPRPSAAGVIPAAYQNQVSPDSRTSGPRHERTGSGLY